MAFFLVLPALWTGLAHANSLKLQSPQDFAEHARNYLDATNKLSSKCRLHMGLLADALESHERWAWKMLDSATKLMPSGLLSGNSIDLGSFDQCLNIEGDVPGSPRIHGKYCLGQTTFKNPLPFLQERKIFKSAYNRSTNGNVTFTFAACLPHGCDISDFEEVYKWLNVSSRFIEESCQTQLDVTRFSAGNIAAITFFSVIATLVLSSTIYDLFLYFQERKAPHPLLTAFSIVTNGRKLFDVSAAGPVPCLHGLRVMSLMWIILGLGRYEVSSALPKKNTYDLLEWRAERRNMYIMSVTLAVDTFFIINSVLTSYTFMSSANNGAKFNIFKFYFQKYLKVTSCVGTVVLIYTFIFEYLGNGPIWYMAVKNLTKGCADYWWSTLLYVHNYVNPDQMCIQQSWFLAVDVQMYVLSPIILIWLPKRPIIGITIGILGIFGTILSSFVIAWVYELRMIYPANPDVPAFNRYYYFATHTRANVWLLGFFLGYVLFQVKHKRLRIPMNKYLATLLWAITVPLLAALIFAGHDTLNSPYNRALSSVYIAMQRPLWALGVGWLTFACCNGYGGPVGWLLASPYVQVISKINFNMYLIHMAVEHVTSGQMRDPPVFNNLHLIYSWAGDYIFVLGTATVLTLAIEFPVATIEGVMFPPTKNKVTDQNENRPKVQDS